MDQIKLAGEVSVEQGNDVAAPEGGAIGRDVRTLNDLELVWVGGGDGGSFWP